MSSQEGSQASVVVKNDFAYNLILEAARVDRTELDVYIHVDELDSNGNTVNSYNLDPAAREAGENGEYAKFCFNLTVGQDTVAVKITPRFHVSVYNVGWRDWVLATPANIDAPDRSFGVCIRFEKPAEQSQPSQ